MLLVILAIAGAVFAAWLLLRPQNGAPSEFPLNISADDTVYSSAANIIYSQNDRIYCVSNTGEGLWSYKMDEPIADFCVSDNYVAVWSESNVNVLDFSNKPVSKPKPDGIIKTVRLCDAAVAVMTEDSSGQTFLCMYDLQGKLIKKIDFTPNEFVLDFGLDSKLDMLWTHTLDTSGVLPVSVIRKYSIARASMTTTIVINDQIPEKLVFTEKNIYAIGTNACMSYNNLGAKESEGSFMVYGWKLAYEAVDASAPVFVFIPRSKDAYTAITSARVVSPGVFDHNISLPPRCQSIFISNGRIYAFTGDSLYQMTFKGESIKEHTLSSNYYSAAPVMDNKYIMVFKQDGCSVLQIP
jgi:outer membrane protein assembly factor BamB